MKDTDRAPLIAIAMMAARADGRVDSVEQRAVDAAVARAGNPEVTALSQQVAAGQVRIADLASRLSDDDAPRAAWEGALAIVNADGSANLPEQAFLNELRAALRLSDAYLADSSRTASTLARAEPHTGPAPAGAIDELILQQAILTGALEIFPDGLANLAILPLQLQMVFQLGGGMFGGATRIATGAIISFSATYALGHVAEQSYAQGRRIDAADLRTLFVRFQNEAKTIYPRVQEQIQRQASTLDLQRLLQEFRTS